MTYNITCTYHYDDLLSLKEEWEALHELSQNPCVFLSWEWIAACWKYEYESGSADLRLLQARDEQGRLVGIAPLMRITRRIAGVFSWRILKFIALPDGSDHADFIIEAGQETAVTRAFLDWLMQNRDWSEMLLEGLASDSPIIPVLRESELKTIQLQTLECPVLIIDRDWDSHFASLSKNKRQVQRRHWRKLDRDFPDQWAWRIVEDPEDVRQVMEELFTLHSAQWRARGLPGSFGDEISRRMHHELAQRFLQRGWLRLYQVTIEDKTVGVFYSYWYLNRAYYFSSGVDLAYSQYNIGHILNEISLRQAFENGMKEYDFLWGLQSYKLQWGPAIREDLVLSCPVNSPALTVYRQSVKTGRTLWKRSKHLLPDNLRSRMRDLLVRFAR
jgi:CelD/BcsL family acetyltransferase involved in cellulose biosynthesis